MKTTVTIMGHAGLFIEAGDCRLLVDPLLRCDPLASQSVAHTYRRELDLSRMPRPTAILLTHGHLDHFDPASLSMLDRSTPLVLPDDRSMHHVLGQLGFVNLSPLRPWESTTLDAVRLTATPSQALIDEFGFVLTAGRCEFLHLADSEPSLSDARRIRDEHGAIALASVKFQPASPAHGVFRSLGPSFDRRQIAEWLEYIAEISPRCAFPYASGVRYQGRHAWLNRYAFPFTSEDIAKVLRARLGDSRAVETVRPGDVFEIVGDSVTKLAQGSAFVRHVDDGCGEPRWEPFDPQTLDGLSTPEEVVELQQRLEAALRQEIAPWLAHRLREHMSPIRRYVDYGIVYQLVVHLGAHGSLEYAIDYRAPTLSITAERHPDANYFAHLSGRGLLDVLRGSHGPEVFYMSGDARIYEKVLAVREGKLWVPPVQGWDFFEMLPEPLTHYLRHTRMAC